MKLSGTITALVTPFSANGSVDYGALKALVEEQVAGGVEGICSVGTSGESPTLSHAEHNAVIEKTIEFAAGRVKIIAGTGANSTSEAIELTKAAIACGGNVVAVKEAAGSVDRVSAIKNILPEFTVLSGDDSLALPMISVGAEGVISVASNVIPREMGDMVRAALGGDFVRAREMHAKYYPLFHDLFIDVNPVMVKEALAIMGKIGNTFRLPLCETTAANREKIANTLKSLGLL